MKITSATIFQRVFESKNAFLLGVIETSLAVELSEGVLYPICFGRNAIYQEHGLPIRSVPGEEPYYHAGMDYHLKRAIWPRVRDGDDCEKVFWVLVVPLPGAGTRYFVYAALERSIFSNPFDSWHQLRCSGSQWERIPALSKTMGENALTLTRKTYWPLGDGLFHIEPNPSPLVSAQSIIRSIYLAEYRLKGSVEHFIKLARERVIQHEIDECLVDSLLYSMHSQYQDEEYLSVICKVEELCPLSCARMVAKSEYIARSKELRRQIRMRAAA